MSPASPGAGEDQHTDNTDGIVFLGTGRHDRYDDDVSPVISQNASELGWVIWLAMMVCGVMDRLVNGR